MARRDRQTVVRLGPRAPMEVDGARIEPQSNGAVVVDLEPQRPAETSSLVDAENLAVPLAQSQSAALDAIGIKVVEMVEADEASRQPWFEHFREGMKRCGAVPVDVQPSFAGQSTCVHPLIVEAATQFQARAIEELFPASGPVKAKVLGESTPELEAQRERVEKHMNYQLMCEDEEYFEDVDRMLFALPFAGSAFKKSYRDPELGIVVSRYVQAEDVILPYHYRGHIKRAPRVTHQFQLSHHGFLARQAAGYYLPMDLLQMAPPNELLAERERVDVAADGVEPSSLDEDREHTMLEMHTTWVLPGIDDVDERGQRRRAPLPRPYILTVERETRRVVSIRRNWKSDQAGRVTPRCWWVHYRYLPGFGAYGYGLLHAIGGLGQAATEALQEFLHAARFSARQGGFKSREARLPRKVTSIEPGVWHDTDMTAEELNRAFYTPPFREPGDSLYRVLGMLVETGRRFASITDAMVGGGETNVPVGTTLARIEQGSKVYSGIHKRLHASAGEEFRLRAELNAEVLSGEQQALYLQGSSIVISAQDYDARIDVVPVSDPNIVSQMQRVAIAQAQVERAAVSPLYDKYEVERRYLEAMRVPDIERVLQKPAEVPPLDPVTEGQRAMLGQPIKAYAEQDHAAHTAVHRAQLAMLAGSELEAAVKPALLAHIAEHMAHAYRLQVSQQVGVPLPSPDDPMLAQGVPPEADAALAQRVAALVAQEMAAMQQQMAAQQAGVAPAAAEEAVQIELATKRAALAKAQAEADKMRREADGMDEAQARGLREQFMAELARIQQGAADAVAEANRRAQAAEAELRQAVEDFRALAQDAEAKGATEREKARIAAEAKVEVERIKAESSKTMLALEQRLAALQQELESLRATEKQTVVMDTTGKALDTTGVKKDVAAVRRDVDEVKENVHAAAKAIGQTAAAIAALQAGQERLLEQIAEVAQAGGSPPGPTTIEIERRGDELVVSRVTASGKVVSTAKVRKEGGKHVITRKESDK